MQKQNSWVNQIQRISDTGHIIMPVENYNLIRARKCQCGTLLSRYNRDKLCSICTYKKFKNKLTSVCGCGNVLIGHRCKKCGERLYY